MSDISHVYRIALLASAFTLGGCETLTALTTVEKTGTPGGRVEVGDFVPDKTLDGSYDDREIPAEVAGKCGIRTKPDDEFGLMAAPAAAKAALALFSIIYGESTDAIQGYVDKKRKRFTKSYGGRINIPDDLFAPDLTDKTGTPVRCIRLTRMSPESPAGQKNPANSPRKMSDIIVRFSQNPAHTAMTAELVHVRLDEFAASTAPESGGDTVKASITIGVSVINSDFSLGRDPVASFTQNFLLPRVERKTPPDLATVESGSAFMPLPNALPVTVAITVTETGSGVENFESFTDDFKENRKIIGDTLGKILEEKLKD